MKNAEHNKGQPPTPAPPPKERGAAVAIGEATESPPVGLKTVESKSCFKRKHPAQERRASDPRVRAVVEAPKSGGCDKTARKEAIAALKQKRGAFLAAHSWSEATPPPPGDVRCSAISSAALAISETMTIAQNTDIDISLQDIFYTLKLPLHHVTLESHTMPEVYDIINKYLAVAEETAISNFRLEFATCDTKIPREESDDDEEEEEEEQTEPHTVEQGRHLTLMDLQKELGQQFATTPSSYIFNYDPYVIQEARILSVLEEEEEDDDDDPAVQKLRQEHFDRRAEELRTVTAVNQGAFAILTGYNASLSEVQLATVHHTLDGLRLTTETTTLATLFRACSVPDLYTQRARGFVRVECSAVAPSPDSPRKTREWFTVSQVEATGNRRMPLELVDPSIYGALVAGGFAVHLYNQKNTGGNAPDEIVCPQPGVAVTEMFNTLNLPLEVLMRPSLRSSSTAEAYSFLREFVSLQGNARKTFVGIMCIKRKGGTSDGAVNFEESDLRQQVQEVDESEGHTVMIVNFDPVKLHHVPGVGESHFGVIVGYSAKRQTVNIADVSPKVFKKVWRVSLARLWEAMVGFGYVLLSPNHGAYGRRVFQSKMDFQNQAIDECGISKMPPHSRFVSFDFPLRVYCVTVMALGLSVLKGEVTTVEEVIRRAGWHMSFLLSDHLSLGDFVRVLEASAPDVACTPVYLDVGGEGALLRTIQESQRDGVELVVNFSAAKLSSMPEWYIGSYGGSYALLESYNEMSSMVVCFSFLCSQHSNPVNIGTQEHPHSLNTQVLTTAAAEKSRRTFSLPLDVLQSLCAEVDSTSGRSRGVVKMSKKSASAQEPEGGAQTLAQTANLLETPIPHPFKLAISPQVAGIAFALSTLGMKVCFVF